MRTLSNVNVRRGMARVAAVALAVGLSVSVLSGCSDSSHTLSKEAASPTPSRSATSSKGDAATVARARLLGQQYDYDSALDMLAPLKSADALRLRTSINEAKAAARVWPDNASVSHLFFHSLIVDASRAFDGDSKTDGYDNYMVTLSEFTKILDSLHSRGFVLVSPHDLAADEGDGQMRYTPIALPAGKTPLVLSEDDVNYYDYETGDGFAANLTVENGRVVNTYIDAKGVETHGSYDVAPVIDDFVRTHPDFAYKGHKGVLGITGYEGVLGYRTSATADAGNPHRLEDVAQAKRVVAALKYDGWEFASHSWGHINYTKSSLEHASDDAARWASEVQPIVGATNLFIYPFGADVAGVEHYSGPKYEDLRARGFKFFFGVDGSTPHWQQLGNGYLRQNRVNVDGIRLHGGVDRGETVLDSFFDPRAVIDPKRP